MKFSELKELLLSDWYRYSPALAVRSGRCLGGIYGWLLFFFCGGGKYMIINVLIEKKSLGLISILVENRVCIPAENTIRLCCTFHDQQDRQEICHTNSNRH